MNEVFQKTSIHQSVLHTQRHVVLVISQFWQARNPREKIILLIGSLVIVLTTIWVWGISPAINIIHAQAKREAALLDKAQKVSAAALKLQEIQAQQPQNRFHERNASSMPGSTPKTSAAELATTLLQQHQLLALAELNSINSDEFRINLQNAPAQTVLQWLMACEQIGLHINHFQLTTAPLLRSQGELPPSAPGLLSGRLIFKTSQATAATAKP